MILKCMIVDDDLMARKSIERLCKKTPTLEVVCVCEDAQQALKELPNHELDLVFLDIEMPELTGLEFLEAAPALPQVICTTSKTEYAFEAFEYQVTDYLKKPLQLPRFQQAITKAIEIHRNNINWKSQANEVYLKEDGRLVRVSFDNILYFENVGDYVKVQTIKGSHIIHGTLKGVDGKLNDPRFLKVHRSFIVNLNKIKDIEENTLVIDKKVIPISRAHKPILMGKLNTL